MRYKSLIKSTLILVCLVCLLATIQTSAAIYFTQSPPNPTPAELVVVFPGDNQRLKPAFKIAKDIRPPHFMVISTTAEDLRKLLTKNGVPETVKALPGGKSRSTFEDVYQTVKTIKENHIRSVMVVTSGYHLPRALFLLVPYRLFPFIKTREIIWERHLYPLWVLTVYLKISGQDVHIQGFPVQDAQKTTITVKQYINETIKFWGSIVEMTGYFFTDQLVLETPNSRKMQKALKKKLLFQI